MRRLALALGILCVGISEGRAESLFLEWNNFGPDYEFIAKAARDNPGYDDTRNLADFVLVGRHDLNRDGLYELIIGVRSIGACGRHIDPFCHAKIYTREGGRPDGAWRFAGDLNAHHGPVGDGRLIFHAEDEYHNGWRIIRDDNGRGCWITDMRHAQWGTKPEWLPGYFGFPLDGTNCPK